MTNEQEVVRSVFSSYINDLKAHSTKPDRPMFKMLEDVKDKAIKALEAQSCIEDYPTCTECEHYDSEKHYCPRFCQVIKDTLAEAQPTDADCISRQDAIDFIIDNYGVGFTSLTNGIRDYLPSVTPQASEEDIHREREQAYMLGYEDASKKFRTEPCEECISRTEAIDKLTKFYNMVLDDINIRDIVGTLEQLPSVTPRTNLAETSQDCISRQKALDCFEQTNTRQGAKYAIETLPSVTPQRPKGKWIEVFVETPNDPYSYGFKSHKCSKCECRPLQISNYCPNCGAEMSGGGEDENSD